MPELTDISVIRALCEKYDFALSKGFGQNFIINPGIPTKIVDASGVDKRYGVIEIGPGIGVLTKELAKRAAKVVSIEVDERLPPLLAETMAGVDNFKLVLQDVLKVDLKALIAAEFPGMPVAVCANLPYYITSPIVMKLLGDRLPIESLTVMVQKEAADRLAAVPGTRASSAISCAVNYYAASRLMFTAAPGSFYPAPKVTSAVVRMDIRPTPAVQVEDEDGYFALIRAGILSVDVGQGEAASALGLSAWQSMRYVILPQALKSVVPALGNSFVSLIKDSSLASVIATPELMYWANAANAQYYRVWETFITTAVIYLFLTVVTSRILAKWEKNM